MSRNETANTSLLDKAEAAAYLNVSTRYIERLWAERRIAALKFGRKLRFERADLDDFKAKHRHDAVD